MNSSPDVAILGGGIIGLTSALQLARAGLRVTVYERGELGREASWAGAGILPPGNFAQAQTEIDRLRAYSVERLPGFCEELTRETGLPTGYWRCGGVEFLGEDESDILELWRGEGIRLAEWSGSGVRPVPGTRTVFLPDCAQLRNPWHLRALAAACTRAGVHIRTQTEVAGWTQQTGPRALRLANGENAEAGVYVIAAGAWSQTLLASLGCHLDIRPVRGQIVLFKPSVTPVIEIPILMSGKRYLVPRQDGRILAGSTEEPEAGFAKATTDAALQSLTRFAAELVPALATSPIESQWCGLRPGSPDGLPSIGRVPGHPNVIAAVGHFRAGVQLSLGTAELLCAMILGRQSPLNLLAFPLDRPLDLAMRPAFRS